MAPKYKVLHLIETMDAIGGMEKLIAEIVSHLNPDEFEAEIWCLHRGGALADELKAKGLSIKVLAIKSYHNPINILELARAFSEAKPSIIHTHTYFSATIGRLAGILAGVKVLIHHVHSSYWHFTKRNQWVDRFLSMITKKIICVSGNVQDFVVRYEGINIKKTMIIYNGISVPASIDRPEAREMFYLDPQEMIITTVANLYENKGHKTVLHALSLLAAQYPHLKYWIVGDGPLMNELKNYCSELNIASRVEFLGARRDIPAILSASDIFVLASINREGMSLAVIEAMAYQVPIIVSQVGGLTEIIDRDINGLVVNPGDPIALSQAIEVLLIHEHRRVELASQAKKKFEEYFKVQQMMRQIEQLYKESLA